MLRQIERTLRRLGTDWIDVYYLHAWDPVTPLDETLSALDALVRSGKVRYLGVSNFFGWQIAKAMGRAAFHRYETISLVTAEYSLVERGVEREILSLCRHEGVAVMPWGPLGGGLLSGKYRGGEVPAGTRAGSISDSTATVRRRLASERSQAIAEAVREIAGRTGRSRAQVALIASARSTSATRPSGKPGSASGPARARIARSRSPEARPVVHLKAEVPVSHETGTECGIRRGIQRVRR